MESLEFCSYIKRCAALIITEPGVIKLFRALKSGKYSRLDNLPMRQLKECAKSISEDLTFIFKRSLTEFYQKTESQQTSCQSSKKVLTIFRRTNAMSRSCP